MKLTHVISLMTLSLVAGLAQASDYEVRLGNKTYVLTEGELTKVLTPKGEEVEISVTRIPILAFSTEGLTFDYSSDMKLESETELGVETVTAETENSTLFLGQIFPYELSPKEAIDVMLGGMQQEFQGFGATFPEDRLSASRRNISGKETTGKKLKFSLGDLRHETEAYAFQRAGKTIVLIFQADHEDREEAETYFKIIADSIR